VPRLACVYVVVPLEFLRADGDDQLLTFRAPTLALRRSLVGTFLLLCAGCGRLGLKLLPLADADDLTNRPDDRSLDDDGGDEPGEAGDAGNGTDAGQPHDSCDDDDDGDGLGNCEDGCPADPDKDAPAICGCGVGDWDANENGNADCMEDCDAVSFVPDTSCGVGYCQAHNTPSTCVNGRITACIPGAPLSGDDQTPDGVDDNCNGTSDEDKPLCAAHTESFGAGSLFPRPVPARPP
jgi:hypothetical protein